MYKEQLKKIAYTVGKFLGILGLVFVFYKLSKEYTLDSFIKEVSLVAYILPVLLLLNYISHLFGIYAWHLMLLNYAKKPFPYIVSYYYFSKTEISKYLPGNIFHFVGRQAIAHKLGISQMQMAKTSVLFSFSILVGTLLSSTCFAFLTEGIPTYILVSMVLSCVVIMVLSFYLYPSFPMKKKITMNLSHALSISLQGIMLGMIVLSQSETMSTTLFFQCVSIYIISWLIGFVTPGASGGLGVREGTFIAIIDFLHINIASEIIVFSVLLIRVINIFIDIILYLSTLPLEKKIKELKL